MSRLTQLTSLLSLASVGLAQIPNIIPFTVTGSLDGYVTMSKRDFYHY
jgi:hypothetical protein